MIQKFNLKLRCQKDDHNDEIDIFCYNQFCKEFRLSCFECIKNGFHRAHLNDVGKLNNLEEYIENKNKECDDLIDELNQLVESLNQSFSLLKFGIRNKYSVLKEKLLNLNQQQINDFLNSIIQFTEYKQLITTIVSEQIKKLNNTFNNLYGQLQLSSFNYQIQDNNIKLSKEFDERGYQLYMDDKYNQAIELFDKSIQSDPNNHFSLQLKGECLRQLNQFENAITWLDKALTINPKHFDSLFIKGDCLKLLNQFENAITWLDKGLAINPQHFNSLFIKGECLKQLDQFENAITWLDKALVINPFHFDSLFIKGVCLKQLNQFENAIFWLNKALTINPSHFDSLFIKGESLKQLNQYEDAITWLDKALVINPQHFYSLFIKGVCLKQLDQFENAIIWLDKGLSIDPKHVCSLSIKGECLRVLKQYENADLNTYILVQDQYKYNEPLIDYEKSLKLEPNDQQTKTQINVQKVNEK
ncbi:unnamed protein product [Paramecium octaurelia]|uniref:Tetratricopeptide repeat protein n=1 Tax=Paramecium octaurelia TaxID=43137 RepID=A0A8S1VA44_PAROT|nr:unnamed protein product [Paramecium octaurelia]